MIDVFELFEWENKKESNPVFAHVSVTSPVQRLQRGLANTTSRRVEAHCDVT